MTRTLLLTAFVIGTMPSLLARADNAQKYLLRYKFQPNETVCWDVEHRSKVRATVSRTTQTTETLSKSLKCWRVFDVQPDGTTAFEHRVDWVDMRQKLTGREEVHYDSRKDKKPPIGFETVAKSIGVPLAVVKMDTRGKVLQRERRGKKPSETQQSLPENESLLTIPLPEKPVAIGETWSLPQDFDIPLPAGTVKKVKAVQQFTLEEVKTGVATIRFATEILTPITDPAVESQLVQRESAGRVRFDIDAGRILSQQIDIDKHVVGFRGEASSIHYVNRFSEHLVTQ